MSLDALKKKVGNKVIGGMAKELMERIEKLITVQQKTNEILEKILKKLPEG